MTTGVNLFCEQPSAITERNTSDYGSELGTPSEVNALDESFSNLSLQPSRVASPLPVSPSQKIDLFYSDAEVDELIQALESSIYTPGTYYYIDPSCPGIEAPEICYLGAWPYGQTAKKNYVKLEKCLFISLNPSQAGVFIRTLNASLQKNIHLFNGNKDEFIAATRKYYDLNLGELDSSSQTNHEIQNFIFVKSMRTAWELCIPKENRKVALVAFSKNFCSIFSVSYLGHDPANNEKREFIDANVKALLKGMVTLSNKYGPLMEGPKGFFASIDKISAILEKTAKAVKDNRERDLLPKHFTECDEGVADDSELSEAAQEHLSEIDQVYDCLLGLLNELNSDIDTIQKQREVMTDVHMANKEYRQSGLASYPYLFGDKTVPIDHTNCMDKDFKMFLDDFYEGVDGLYFSHKLYFRKAISAVENVRLTLEGIIDRYQELISLS